jgi:predicted transcriptional regulator of viral defense system
MTPAMRPDSPCGLVNIVPLWKDIDTSISVPHSRFDEIATLAEENDGLITSSRARSAGIADSVLARMVKRGRLERVARGVYRMPYFPPDRFSQYREAILWAQASGGPGTVTLSHETALVVYGISDANPASVHLTVPKSARFRRERPRGIILHPGALGETDIRIIEGLPVTTVGKTISDLVEAGARNDIVSQAISDARREGFIAEQEARRLRRLVALGKPADSGRKSR